MMVKLFASAVYGVEAITITTEVDVLDGLKFFVVGLPDNAVKESQHRVESAIKNNHYRFPRIKVVINLSPADIRKSGSAFDLPIAIGILAATEQVKQDQLAKYIIMGELSLDGSFYLSKGPCLLPYKHARRDLKGCLYHCKMPVRQGWLII